MGTGVWRAAYLLTRDEARRIAAKPLKARKYAAGTGTVRRSPT